ncbi:MAG TPA: GMC family oxidoreductase N-terminal domain-containing protein [Rhodocyclaceae bacterium]|nr:GMC family oxidoreductase N-terminal domain-containing protein [Rhodocyclaceae bacterium]
MPVPTEFEAIVVGSGFGGAVMCARLAKRWPGKVLLLERGKEYPLGSFPRSPHGLGDNVWYQPSAEGRGRARRAKPRRKADISTGLFDIRHFDQIDTVTAAGLGGGSLIYANVFLPPPAQVFEQGWPEQLRRTTLEPYYEIARSVLGARPIPPWSGPQDRRYIERTVRFREFAKSEGLVSRDPDLCVFFGQGYSYDGKAEPTEIGVQEANRFGARQTSCTYCGECDIGCNVHAKNTTDHNYIHAARQRYGARVETEALVERITPLSAAGQPDPQADGSHGYAVVYRQLKNEVDGGTVTVTAQRVVVSAGTLGSNELLLRCRDVEETLPNISPRLGTGFSGNGDFLSFAIDGNKSMDATYGPVITQYTDHHLFTPLAGKAAFVLEDASYPTQVAAAIAALPLQPLARLWWMLKQIVSFVCNPLYPGRKQSSVGHLLERLVKHDLSQYSAVLLCMGLDRANGKLKLKQGWLDIDWPQASNMPLYDGILGLCKRFTKFIGGRKFLPMPTWLWPVHNNVTVHPLGGCAIADSPAAGVVSAAPGRRGQVFGYEGLYVADGSLMPTALGANPCATIAALAEWIAHDITGIAPDDQL